VHAAFYPPPPAPSASPTGRAAKAKAKAAPPATVDVLNGGSTPGVAGRVSAALTRAGYRAGHVGNTSYRAATAVVYGRGMRANDSKLAAMFGVTAAPGSSVAAGHVEILLGTSAGMPRVSPRARPQAPVAAIPSTGPEGGAVSAANGIPCVN
jgi:hypothetical protein